MPLARIITRTPQNAFAASEYLRAQGYTVETVSPEEFRVTPAELELKLEKCRPDEALARAMKLLESPRGAVQGQTEVSAAPEPVLPQRVKIPVAYDIAGRPVEFAGEEEPERRQKPTSIGRTLASLLSRVTAPVRDSQQRLAEQRALKLQAGLTREQEEINRREEELARERARQETERQRAAAELAERRRQERIVAEQQAAQERARVAVVQEARMVAEREAARQQPEPAAAKEPAKQQLPARRPPPARPVAVRRRRAPIVISGKAVATTFGASLLLLLGFAAYTNRRPASPLSPGALMMNGSVQQDVPFGAVTLTPPAAAPKPSPVSAVTAKISPAVRPATRAPRRKQQSPPSTAKLKHDSETE